MNHFASTDSNLFCQVEFWTPELELIAREVATLTWGLDWLQDFSLLYSSRAAVCGCNIVANHSGVFDDLK